MPLKYVPLGLAGIEGSKHSPFLEDLKVPTAEIDSFYKLNEPCEWPPFYGCALWHHIQLRNLQKRLQVQDPGSEMHAITVLYAAGTVPLLKSKNCSYDFVFLNIKHHS